MEVTKHADGRFCWADLATSDAEGAKSFYGDLFGWEFRDLPLGEGMVYSMAQIKGKDVAALYRMIAEKGITPHWQPYVSVESADAAAGKVEALGGVILAPPFTVFDAGRMALFKDPSGAPFAVWEARKHPGAQRVGEPGTICWNELVTKAPEQSEPFYQGLFGWGPRVMDAGLGPYTIFSREGVELAGMIRTPAECVENPSSWLMYFLVDDCDQSAEKAKTLGARILKGGTDIPTIGRFAVIQDPQGGVFALFKPSKKG